VKHKPPLDMYTQMGMAALLPGMQYALEQMHKLVEDFREQLAGLQNGSGKTTTNKVGKKIATGYWDKMTPEQRSAEMKRRMASRSGLHPRDSKHPKHNEWLRKVRLANRRRWESMTPQQQREQMSAAGAGRTKQLQEAS
jgi:hypothetical protein